MKPLQTLIQAGMLSLTLVASVPVVEAEIVTGERLQEIVTQKPETVIRQENEQSIRNFLELLSQKRMDEWLALWDEQGVQDMPYSPKGFPKRLEGKGAIAKHYSALPTSVGRMVFPDLVIYPTTEPNTFFAEYRGEIEIKATGKPYNNNYAALFKFRNGRIVLFREYYDPIVFAEAWGATLEDGFNLDR
jgi:uncharacterized protein